MGLLKSEINDKDFDLYNQAEKYIKPKGKDHNVKIAKKLVKVHKEKNKSPIIIPEPNDINIENEKLRKLIQLKKQVKKYLLETQSIY